MINLNSRQSLDRSTRTADPAMPRVGARVARCLRPAILPLVAMFAACDGESGTEPPSLVPTGILVLDGYIQPGLTLLPDSGSTSRRIAFGASDVFDGGSFFTRSDSVVAASSRGAGDLLYIANVQTGVVRRVQMPATSNPAGARLLSATDRRALVGVPLRDSATVMLVSVGSDGSSTFTRVADVGLCPVDVFQHGGDLWVLDANANCAVDYSPVGPMRLIRVPANNGARQIIALPELRGSSASVVVRGTVGYVSAPGDADFSSFPYTLRTGAAITRVDLTTGSVLGTRMLPVGSYGANAKLGLDDKLHVSFYENLADFATRTISFTLPDLTPSGVRVAGADWLADANGDALGCSSGLADGLGRLHCLDSRAGAATFLQVFGPDGSLVREVAAGQGGVDIRFR